MNAVMTGREDEEMSPENRLKLIAELVEPYAVWWDAGGGDHHIECPLYRNEEDDDGMEGPDACDCWLGAAWRIRDLALGK